jgi:hypothetical protein
VLRGSSGISHLNILEGKICGKRGRGRPRLTWMDNILTWLNMDNYAVVKGAAEDRGMWRIMAVNLLVEDGT